MNVVLIGAGYVGLVSGACFAEFRANVACIDKEEYRIDALEAGKSPIYGPGLEDPVKRGVESWRLSFTTSLAGAVADADLVFIAVGTPTRRGDGHADLKIVYATAVEIAEHLQGYTVIVDKSTVPVGTAREVQRIMRKNNPEADFDVASNPEFLRGGSAITDFMRPDRVVIGVKSKKAESLLRELYRPLNLIEAPSWLQAWKARKSPSTPPTPSWPSRSASSTRSPSCAKKSVRTCIRSPEAWAWTVV